RLLAVHAELLRDGPVPELNLGGGYGIAYTSAERAPDIDVIATELAAALEAGAARHGIPVPHLAIEPGRWIVGPAGVTLYEVGTVKDVTLLPEGSSEPAVRRYVAVDGGMSDNVRPALYDAYYT